jgi:hypothetical protein
MNGDKIQENVKIDLVKEENNSIRICKSDSLDKKCDKDQKAESSRGNDQTEGVEKNIAQLKLNIIDYYEKMQNEIDLRAEQLLMELPEILNSGREELLKQIEEEKEKCLAALAHNSPLQRQKAEYYQRFLELKEEFKNCGNDENKREEIFLKLDDLKKKVSVIEEFLDDFKNRVLTFEEIDKSFYSSLIGELVIANENQANLELISNQLLSP